MIKLTTVIIITTASNTVRYNIYIMKSHYAEYFAYIFSLGLYTTYELGTIINFTDAQIEAKSGYTNSPDYQQQN